MTFVLLFSPSACAINRQMLFVFHSSDPKLESNELISPLNGDRSPASAPHWQPVGQILPLGQSDIAMRMGACGIKHDSLPGAAGRQANTINIFSTVSPPFLFQKPNPLEVHAIMTPTVPPALYLVASASISIIHPKSFPFPHL